MSHVKMRAIFIHENPGLFHIAYSAGKEGESQMASSLLASLVSSLDRGSVGAIAGALGESEQSISRGLQTSIAAILGSVLSKSQDASFMQRVLDLVPSTFGNITWSRLAADYFDPHSPLLVAGKQALSTIFGNSESSVMNAISAETGLRSSIVSSLMALAAPMTVNLLNKK